MQTQWHQLRNGVLILLLINLSVLAFFSNRIFSLKKDLKNDEYLAIELMRHSPHLKKALGGFQDPLLQSGVKLKYKRVRGDARREFSLLEYEIKGRKGSGGRAIILLKAESGLWVAEHFRYFSKDGTHTLFSKDILRVAIANLASKNNGTRIESEIKEGEEK